MQIGKSSENDNFCNGIMYLEIEWIFTSICNTYFVPFYYVFLQIQKLTFLIVLSWDVSLLYGTTILWGTWGELENKTPPLPAQIVVKNNNIIFLYIDDIPLSNETFLKKALIK